MNRPEVYRLNGEVKNARIPQLHPAWLAFIKYCEEIGYGEIEKLKLQDGLPMMAEEVKRKVKFSG